jgi:hypothetical protein
MMAPLRIAVVGALTGYVAHKIGIHFPSSPYDLIDFWIVTDAQPIQWPSSAGSTTSPWSPRFDGPGHTPSSRGPGCWQADCVTRSSAEMSSWASRRASCGRVSGLGGVVMPNPVPILTGETLSPPAPPLALAIPALASSRQFLLRLVLFLVATNMLDEQSAGIMPAAVAGLIVAVAFRFGLLSTAVMAYVRVTQIYLPSTTDPTVWYAGVSALSFAIAVGLAVYGFLVSLAGKPIFGRSILQA